jgi:hypothetical protein
MPFPLTGVDMVVRTNWSDLLEVESPPSCYLLAAHLLRSLGEWY